MRQDWRDQENIGYLMDKGPRMIVLASKAVSTRVEDITSTLEDYAKVHGVCIEVERIPRGLFAKYRAEYSGDQSSIFLAIGDAELALNRRVR